MASDSKSRGWVVVVALAIAFIFLNKYLLIGAQAVLGVMLPGSTPLVSQPEKVAAPEPTAYLEATKAPEPTRAAEVVVEEVVTVAQASTQPVTITIWHSWVDSELAAVQSIFNEYSLTHPGVTIELQKQDDIVAILPTVLAAGEGPDIIAWYSGVIGKLAPDALLPLDEQGFDQYYMENEFMPGPVNSVRFDNHYWGFPTTQMGMALVINTALLGEDTIIPNDLDIFIEMARNYESDHPGMKFFCSPGFDSKDAYYLAPIFFSLGLPGYVDFEGNVYMNKEESIWAAERMLELKDLTSENSSYDTCQNAFLNGEVPIWWTGAWTTPMLEDSGMDYEVAAMGRPFLESYALMLPRSVEYRNHTAIALDIMQYFANAEMQTKMVVENRIVPSSYQASVSSEVLARKGISEFAWVFDQSVPLFSTTFTDLQWGVANVAFLSFLNGSQSPRDALTAAQVSLESQVAASK